MAGINLLPARFPVAVTTGNDVTITLDVNDALGADYTWSGKTVVAPIVGHTTVTGFTVDTSTDGTLVLSLTDAQTTALGSDAGFEWSLSVTVGTATRTWLSGPLSVYRPGRPGATNTTTGTLTVAGAAGTAVTVSGLAVVATGVAFTPTGTVAATTVQAAIAEVSGDVTDHLADTADAHDASAVSVADAGGYYTGTNVETVLAELPGKFGTMQVVDAVTYGTGLVDASAHIQAKIAAASAAGGTVFFPAGEYLIVTEIAVGTGVSLLGAGYGSVLRKNATDNNDVVVVDGKTDVEISNLRIRNSSQVMGESAFCIRVTSGSARVSIHHCFLENSWIGVGVLDVTPLTPSSSVTITDNFITNVGNNGVGVNGTGAEVTVSGNTINTFGTQSTQALGVVAAGIEVRGNLYGSVCDNRIGDGDYDTANRTVDGIRIEYDTNDAVPAKKLVVASNTIHTVSGHGIRHQYCKETVVANNVIVGCRGQGIYVLAENAGPKHNERNLVVGNYIEACETGIFLEGSGSGQVRGNIFANNMVYASTYLGVRVTVSYDNQFTGNRVVGGASIGIYLESGERNTFTDCHVIDNTGAGITVLAGDKNKLVDCQSYDTRGTKLQTYGLTVGGSATDTLVVGGIFGPNLTGAISDAGTYTGKIGTLDAANSAAAVTTRGLLVGTGAQARGYGSLAVLRQVNTGTEVLWVERFSGAALTANLFIVGDENGNARVFVGPRFELVAMNTTTAARPAANTIAVGGQMYDTTLSVPIFSDGTNWRDGAGTIV